MSRAVDGSMDWSSGPDSLAGPTSASLMTIRAVRAPASAAPGLRSFWRRSATAGSARWCRSRRRAWPATDELAHAAGVLRPRRDADRRRGRRLRSPSSKRPAPARHEGNDERDGADHPTPARPMKRSNRKRDAASSSHRSRLAMCAINRTGSRRIRTFACAKRCIGLSQVRRDAERAAGASLVPARKYRAARRRPWT